MREPWLPTSAVCGFGRDQGDTQPARSVDPSSECVREMALYVRGVGGSDSVRGRFTQQARCSGREEEEEEGRKSGQNQQA